ncbi:hypothetical protein [Thalassobaculum sp.]|uniref:hypothetical protein n=1 Tax=Thalassobaculum sp. TaxID=2022740 RepID=UPI0032EB118E
MTLCFLPARATVRVVAAVLTLAALSGCNPYVWGGVAAFAGPQAATGRNTFYHINKYLGRSCSDYNYFDRPVHCANDAG